MKFLPTTSEGWSNLVLLLTTILGLILAFATLKNSKPKGKKHRIRKYFKRITVWGWVTLGLSIMIGVGSYRSQALAKIELENEKAELNSSARKDSLKQEQQFAITLEELQANSRSLKVKAKVDTGRYDITLKKFGQQLNEIINTQDRIEALQHPLFPISIEYQLEIDISQTNLTGSNRLSVELFRLKGILDTVLESKKRKYVPENFKLEFNKPDIFEITLAEFNPIERDLFPDPFNELYGQIVFGYIPDITLFFHKSNLTTEIGKEISDFVLVGNDLGTFRGDSKISLKYRSGRKVRVTVTIENARFFRYNGYFNSIEQLKNGYLAVNIDHLPVFSKTKARLSYLKIICGQNKTDFFNLNYSEDDVKEVLVDGVKSKVYFKTGTEVLAERNKWFF